MNLHLQTANNLNFSMKEYLQAIDKADILTWLMYDILL